MTISFDDPRWGQLKGGYRLHYNPVPGLRRLAAEGDVPAVWTEFWNELHHQGDVDEASYAAVPALVDIQERGQALGANFYALCATVEIERHRTRNPPLPAWLSADYKDAWRRLLPLALRDLTKSLDADTSQNALAVVALAKGFLRLGAFLWLAAGDEVSEFLEERAAWSELYDEHRAG